MFQKVDAYAGDPILSLMERFKEDPRSDKVNLSIGLYYNEDGIIPQLKAVAEAEARLNAAPHGASLYLPMEGLNTYRNAIAPLLFGADHAVLAQKRVATIQTLGGSGALKVGADFLKNTSRIQGYGSAIPPGKTTWRFLRVLALRWRPIHGSTVKPTACALTRCWKN
ncbi:aromatic-amino-acid aminotransferase [Enterobacter cloacae]|uniref:Aromatic-amino-acid aminotransferase n=1 Tax=Enterobacter cloacae TaxID=550 RepID=A0A377LP68_ENTCL|nr:aromatic-amino-acid aminotransferase [Enterobacter cloacae]